MKKYSLDNVYLDSDSRDPLMINIDKYYIYTQPVVSMSRSNYTRHNKTASIEFEGAQEDSILYYGGRYGTKYKTRKRKLIEDILIIGSILTGWNWGLTSRRKYNYYPLQPISHLSQLYSEVGEVESHFKSALKRLLDKNWQIQYENGFHLRMLFNQSNINHMESRFLSNMIIWEWLYPHEKNPNGANSEDESQDLKEIINYILTKHWPAQYKRENKNNIFHALRNQLAHSGTLPINRRYAEDWMKQILWDAPNGRDLQSYLKFFNILTQVVVLKTIDINADYLIQFQLNNYLSKGSLD